MPNLQVKNSKSIFITTDGTRTRYSSSWGKDFSLSINYGYFVLRLDTNKVDQFCLKTYIFLELDCVRSARSIRTFPISFCTCQTTFLIDQHSSVSPSMKMKIKVVGTRALPFWSLFRSLVKMFITTRLF